MPALSASYLRVYEPISAFDKQSQVYWRGYVHDGRAVTLAEGPGRQRTTVLEALGAHWSRLPDLPDDAYVLQYGEHTLICPWNLRVRVAEAALQARDGVPPVLADAFVPPALVGVAQTVVSDWNSVARVSSYGAPRQHEQVATWNVPLRWFVLVSDEERELSLERGRRVLRFRTEISKARRRAHRALSVLRRCLGDVPISEAVEESARWLEEFHSRSIVELDYGGLAELLPDDVLHGDDSPSLVSAGLTALANGDAETATASYERLVERWRAIQLLERCN
ncbi:MAG TPA: hypothetical protein VH561_05565 [Micromonosporaceae bacterium]